MPTLINELTSQQRSWLFETFGRYDQDELSGGEASDDLESTHYNHDTTPIRRNSNESIYRESPTPFHIQPFQGSSTDHHLGTLPSPPTSANVTESPDNRNSIFRRSIGSSASGGQPSPILLNERPTKKPHPGSVWSPILDHKVIATTTPNSVHPLYNSNEMNHYDHSIGNTNNPNNFLLFPRPPFARSTNHHLNPSISAPSIVRVPGGAMDGSIPITPSLRHHDPSNYHYHPFQMHHNPIPAYSMRPTQNNTQPLPPKNHHPTSSGKSNTPQTHRLPSHLNHHTSKTDLTNKSIIFPHTEEKLSWLQSFENLKLYKKIYGDCNVPQKYKMNVKLGGWVNKQRKKKKNPAKYGKLTEEQIASMEEIGFKWIVETVQET